MKIIGFAGPARAGKSECANIVASICDEEFNIVRESFAKPMRVAISRLGISKETQPELYRATMQRWGESRRTPTAGHPKWGENYWINRMLMRLMCYKMEENDHYRATENRPVAAFHETVVLIEDVRYPNEVALIQALDGIVVFIDPKNRVDLSEPFRSHHSEAMANGYMQGKYDDALFDEVVVNDRSKKSLIYKLKSAVPQWLSRIWS